MSEAAGMVLMATGIFFDLIGCVGLVRLPDVYNRLQAATKCVTLGTCLILIGGALSVGSAAAAGKLWICMVFILITSPTGAHALARGARRSGVNLWDRSVVDEYEWDREPELPS